MNTTKEKERRRLLQTQFLKENTNFDELPLKDIKTLFYELQIHQIELEMQNEELRNTQLELETTREKFFDLYNQVPVGYLTLSENGLITEANLTSANRLGVTRNLLLNQPITRFILKEDQDVYYLKTRLLIKTQKKQQFEIRMTGREGNTFWVDFACVPVKTNDDGSYYRAIFEDITDRKNAEFTIQQKNIELQELNVTKDKFFSILSHDLKGPMGSIVSLLEMLQNDCEDRQEKMLSLAYQSAKRTYTLLEELLLWGRLQINKVQFNSQMIDLKWLINDVVLFQKYVAADKKEIKIQTNLTETVVVFCDIAMVKVVIQNLLSNAIKFSNPGGVVTVGCKPQEGNKMLFYVSDTGIGIPPQEGEKLFLIDQFFSTKGTGGEQGTGLGLILCKELIEKHGGAIWIESETDKGSSFYFTLPTKEFT